VIDVLGAGDDAEERPSEDHRLGSRSGSREVPARSRIATRRRKPWRYACT
jgi:hypothetical protein